MYNNIVTPAILRSNFVLILETRAKVSIVLNKPQMVANKIFLFNQSNFKYFIENGMTLHHLNKYLRIIYAKFCCNWFSGI